MQHRTLWAFVSVVVLAAAACGGGGSEGPANTAAPVAPPAPAVDPATVGTVTGMVTLEGSPPPPENIRMNSDPVCVTEATDTQTEYYAVGSAGELGNVFVYVKEGLEGRTFPPATGDGDARPEGLPIRTPRLWHTRGTDV